MNGKDGISAVETDNFLDDQSEETDFDELVSLIEKLIEEIPNGKEVQRN